MRDESTTVEPRLSVQAEPLLVRRQDAAKLLAISPRAFDDLVDAGLIGKTRIGGCVAYGVEELKAFVRQCRLDPESVRVGLEKLRTARERRRASKAKSST
jgi:hypothetical protein